MHEQKTFKVKGMHCASCAGTIERTLKKKAGVASAEVNYGTETAKLTFDPAKTGPEALSKEIEHLGYAIMPMEDHSKHAGIGQPKHEKMMELEAMRRNVRVAVPLAAVSALIMAWDIHAQFRLTVPMPSIWMDFFHHLLPLMATYMLFVVGRPYLLGAYRFFRYGKANMDSLIGIGTSAAFLYSFAVSAFEDALRPFIDVEHSYYDVTIVVIAFIALGKYLETRSKIRTGDAIEKLLSLQAKTALVIRDGKETDIPVEQVVHGDIVVVKPAGRIPVDGTVVEGTSHVDESLVTGEPMPVRKSPGDTVVSGTMNGDGAFTYRATKVGAETTLARIIKMVGDAQASRAPIQALADRISAVFVPIVLVIAVLSLLVWILAGTGPLGFQQALSHGLVAFVGVLVIACPCALGLATPTAIIVGVGKGAKEGILIKDAATLERLHEADTVVVDKTGTVTNGRPEIVSVRSLSDLDNDRLIAILASLEKRSEHPIAHAVMSFAKSKRITLSEVSGFEIIKGRGLKGTIGGTSYVAGNPRLAADLGLTFDATSIEAETAAGRTPVLLADDKRVLGVIMVADALKPEAKEAVARLHAMGIKVLMLTGDDRRTAEHIARETGIDEVLAEASPEDKLRKIEALQAAGRVVVMAGDGVNDAPALAKADVGIAMATGTDVAIESAGITLLHGDLSKLVKAVRLSKLTMRGIRQNLFWAFAYNIVGIPLAAGAFYPLFGWLLSPVFAGLAMAFSSVSVVGNSLRLKSMSLDVPDGKAGREFAYAFPIAAAFMAGFFLLQKSGLTGLIGAGEVTYVTAFTIGIIASLSTCMAVVGGLVLSMSATFAKAGDRFRPQAMFHAGRFVSFFVLGGAIGAIGSAFRLDGTAMTILQLAVIAVMLLLGINLLDVFPWAKKLQPAMPRFLSKYAYGLFDLDHMMMPVLVGIGTFFLPCGFTQSMQVYALSTGSFIKGALTMTAFALGTFPVLALLSFGSAGIGTGRRKGIFFKTAGLVVIAFALFNLAGTLAAAGIIPPLFNI